MTSSRQTVSLYAFGANDEGQLGIGESCKILATPTLVPNNPHAIKSIKCGSNHTLILAEPDTAWGAGQLIRDKQKQSQPRLEKLCEHVSLCAATGETSACILQGESEPPRLCTEGIGRFGELGCEENYNSTPREDKFCSAAQKGFVFPSNLVDLAGGNWHYVAVLDNGGVYGWGRNRYGQLGPVSSLSAHTTSLPQKVGIPHEIEGIAFKVRRVVCGKEFTYLAGDPATGEHLLLGRDHYNLRSGMPNSIPHWKDIGATWHSIIVLFEDGSLQGWGKENQWKLVPADLPLIKQIAVGTEHILALTREGGHLLSWGWGFHGNCGDLEGLIGVKPGGVVSGIWNKVEGIEGQTVMLAAGFCTSFVVTTKQETSEKDNS